MSKWRKALVTRGSVSRVVDVYKTDDKDYWFSRTGVNGYYMHRSSQVQFHDPFEENE